MRRNGRSGPGIVNCEFVTAPSGGEVVTASDGSETAKLAEFSALADRRPQEMTEAATRRERQRGDFTAGFLLEPATANANRTSRGAGTVFHPRNRVVPHFRVCDFRP